MRIGIDIDDTLNEFSEAIAEAYFDETGINCLEDVRRYFFMDRICGMTSEDVIRFFERNHKRLYEQTRLKPYLPQMLNGLRHRHMALDIITNRMDDNREVTLKWLHDNNVLPYIDRVYFTSGCKYEFCETNGIKIDLMIEDRLDRAKPFLEHKIPVILFDYEHNRGYEHRLLHRVTNWWEVFQIAARLQTLSGGWQR